MADTGSTSRSDSRPASSSAARPDAELAEPLAPPPLPPLDEVDEASMESFPASDPPPWTTLTAGAPERVTDPEPPPPAAEAS